VIRDDRPVNSTTAELTLAPLRRAHRRFVERQHAATGREHAQRVPRAFKDTFAHRLARRTWLRTLLASAVVDGDGGPVFARVALESGAPIGYILISRLLERDCPAATVVDICVLSEHRRRGVAERLLEEGLAWCRAGGVELLEANIWAGNTASRRLFEARGFVERWRLYGLGRDNASAAVATLLGGARAGGPLTAATFAGLLLGLFIGSFLI